jgi:hypothetical protein
MYLAICLSLHLYDTYIYICVFLVCLGAHEIVNGQGLGENMKVLSTTPWTSLLGTSAAQGKPC